METFKKKIGLGLRKDSKTFVQESTFRVRYLGYCLNFRPGVEGIQGAVDEIRKTGGQRDYRNTIQTNCIKVSDRGVSFVERKREEDTELTFIPLRKISYGLVYNKESNIFAFNHHVSPKHVECHAVECESELKVREINEAIYSAFRADHFEGLRKDREKVKESLQADAVEGLKNGQQTPQ